MVRYKFKVQIWVFAIPFNIQGHIETDPLRLSLVGFEPTQRWQPVIRCQPANQLGVRGLHSQVLDIALFSSFSTSFGCNINAVVRGAKCIYFFYKTQRGDPSIVSALHYFCIMES